MNSMYGGTGQNPYAGKSNTGYTKKGGMPGDILPKHHRVAQIQNFDPMQTALYEQAGGHLAPDSYLSRLAGGDQSLFEEMEAPAREAFSSTLGNVASRYSGLGGGPGSSALSNRRSSGFQHEMTSEASRFAQQLQAQRQGLQRQALGDLMGYSQMLLGQEPISRNIYQKPQKQGGTPWGKIAGTAVGAGAGLFFGGPAGAAAGAQFGGQFGGSFDRGGGSGNFDFGSLAGVDWKNPFASKGQPSPYGTNFGQQFSMGL